MKHQRALFRTLVSAVLALSFIAFAAGGAAADEDDADGVVLNVPFVNQRTIVWCWLAVSEMAIRYRTGGPALAQCQMIERIHGFPAGACCGNPSGCQRTGMGWPEIQNVLWSFGRLQSRYEGRLSPYDVRGYLEAGNPIIANIRTQVAGATHVVVIRGIRETRRVMRTPLGPQTMRIVELLINDPMQSRSIVIPYDDFANVWLDSLVVGERID